GATLIGTVTSGTVSSGSASASFPLSGVNADTYTLEAVYNPAATNPQFNTSSDATHTLTVNQAQPAFSNLAAPTVVYGTTTATLSGTITSDTPAIPTGTVTITVNGVTVTPTITAGTGAFSATIAPHT